MSHSLKQFEYIPEWAARTFPEQTVDGARAKFIEEFYEFATALDESELPDVFVTLINYVASLPGGLPEFCGAVHDKMNVNMNDRKWSFDPETGTGQHVEGGE